MVNMNFDMSKVNLIIIKDLAELRTSIAKINSSGGGGLIVVDIGVIRKEIRDVKTADNKSWLNVIKNVIRKIKEEADCLIRANCPSGDIFLQPWFSLITTSTL